jgi:hypothetical protein
VDGGAVNAREFALEADVNEVNVKARSAGRKHNFMFLKWTVVK